MQSVLESLFFLINLIRIFWFGVMCILLGKNLNRGKMKTNAPCESSWETIGL